AFARLADREVMLVLVGPDTRGCRAGFERTVRELGISDRVLFTGMLAGADRVAALAEAVLFAAPSFHENFGVAVVEAMAAGLPVIISDHVYIHHDVSGAGAGAVVPLDVDALVRELDRWLADADLRRSAAPR